jgi:dipeptidyl aminopeptidase/acylaminoacyl peptidase
MRDGRDLLDRYATLFEAPEHPYERLLRRRDRKRRTNRIVAGAVGLAAGIAAVLVGTSLLSSGPTPTRPAPTPISTGSSAPPTETPSTTSPITPESPIAPESSTILRPGETLVVEPTRILAYGGSPGMDRILATCRAPCRQFNAASVSADGTWLAYDVLTCLGTPPCDPEAGVWVVGPEGGRRQVTRACPSASDCRTEIMAWSQQGATLAVFRGGDHPEILTIDPATGQQEGLSNNGSDALVLAWSPDSKRIAYATTDALQVVDLTTGTSSLLANDAGAIDDIEWSPDGTRVAFDTTQEGRNRIVVVDADGSNPVVLVDQGEPQGPGAPRWSPDGTRIAYVTTPGGFSDGGNGFSFEVWVIDADGSSPTKLFHGTCCIGDWRPPVWSQDGARVAFWDDVDGSSDLSTWLAVRADGSGQPQPIPGSEVHGW